MTSTEIRRKIGIGRSPIGQSRYTFDLLNDLHPPDTKNMRLFVWEDFEADHVKDLFPLLLGFVAPFWKTPHDIKNEIEVSIGEKIISFTYGRSKKITVDRLEDNPVVRAYENERCVGIHPLIAKIKNNKSHIYIEIGFDNRLNYVDRYYDSNDKYFYCLNILGFLLLTSNSEKIGLQKIREVISNSSIVKVAPFLEYWEEFEVMGFKVMDELLSIGNIYKDQISKCDSVTLLEFRVTEKYLKDLEEWVSPTDIVLYPSDNKTAYRSASDYDKFLLYKIHVMEWQRFRLLGRLTALELDHDRCVNAFLSSHPSEKISTYL
jgi:hypothetical protein